MEAGYLFAFCFVALTLLGLPIEAARAQDGPTGACFSIIAGRADTPEAGTFLLNRCSGQSWILMRPAKGGRGYRWSPIEAGAARATGQQRGGQIEQVLHFSESPILRIDGSIFWKL
jgi:hypothetical protein